MGNAVGVMRWDIHQVGLVRVCGPSHQKVPWKNGLCNGIFRLCGGSVTQLAQYMYLKNIISNLATVLRKINWLNCSIFLPSLGKQSVQNFPLLLIPASMVSLTNKGCSSVKHFIVDVISWNKLHVVNHPQNGIWLISMHGIKWHRGPVCFGTSSRTQFMHQKCTWQTC